MVHMLLFYHTIFSNYKFFLEVKDNAITKPELKK